MPKHVPIRTCVGCRLSMPKRDLVRIVRSPDGEVDVDLTGKAPGRGAYVCRKRECLLLALGKNRLGKALRGSIRPEEAARLESRFEELS